MKNKKDAKRTMTAILVAALCLGLSQTMRLTHRLPGQLNLAVAKPQAKATLTARMKTVLNPKVKATPKVEMTPNPKARATPKMEMIPNPKARANLNPKMETTPRVKTVSFQPTATQKILKSLLL